jgi:hypothetical protein
MSFYKPDMTILVNKMIDDWLETTSTSFGITSNKEWLLDWAKNNLPEYLTLSEFKSFCKKNDLDRAVLEKLAKIGFKSYKAMQAVKNEMVYF